MTPEEQLQKTLDEMKDLMKNPEKTMTFLDNSHPPSTLEFTHVELMLIASALMVMVESAKKNGRGADHAVLRTLDVLQKIGTADTAIGKHMLKDMKAL